MKVWLVILSLIIIVQGVYLGQIYGVLSMFGDTLEIHQKAIEALIKFHGG